MCCCCVNNRCPPGLDDEDDWADILTSDDAQALLSTEDQAEAEKVATQVRQQVTLAAQVQKDTCIKVGHLKGGKKQHFSGIEAPVPPLDASMQLHILLSKMPPQRALEVDTFNGRWRAGQ